MLEKLQRCEEISRINRDCAGTKGSNRRNCPVPWTEGTKRSREWLPEAERRQSSMDKHLKKGA